MRPSRRLPLALAAVLAVGCASGGGTPEATSDTPVEVEPDDGASAPLEDDPGTEDEDPGPEEEDDDPGPDEDDAQGEPDDGDDSDGDDGPAVPDLHPQIDDLDEIVVSIDAADDEVRVDAKVAESVADRQRGLMEVEDLPPGVGMLFVFEELREGGFWMKDTLVPLDIAFSDEDGEILEILTMEPCEADPCPTYDPEVAYLTALEVPAGWFAEVGVEPGDELTWSDPVPAA
jgi:uncharacterized protein